MNAGHAESFVYVHYNHRLLRRCREDYEGLCKNWNDLIFDDNLKIDMIAVEDTEYAVLCADDFYAAESSSTPTMSCQT